MKNTAGREMPLTANARRYNQGSYKKSTYLPPKICMPRRAAIRINKNNKKIRLTIDLMLLTREVARFLSDRQCL